ncbi:MAG: MFS transporter, partial [bacterium]
PALGAWVGVSGIFLMTAMLAVLGILILLAIVPSPSAPVVPETPTSISEVLQLRELLRLDLGILVLHLVMTALFLIVPLSLRDAGLPVEQHSLLYLAVLVVSLIMMVPLIILAERKGHIKKVFAGAIGLLAIAQCALYLSGTMLWTLVGSLVLFFWAFNLLEALLPSLVSKVAPASAKGTAMGIYSTSQFLGAFLGGVLGGAIHEALGASTVFLFCAGISLVWLAVAAGMKTPATKGAISRGGR